MKLKDTKPGDKVKMRNLKVVVVEHNLAGTFTAVKYLRRGSNPNKLHGWNSDTDVVKI